MENALPKLLEFIDVSFFSEDFKNSTSQYCTGNTEPFEVGIANDD